MGAALARALAADRHGIGEVGVRAIAGRHAFVVTVTRAPASIVVAVAADDATATLTETGVDAAYFDRGVSDELAEGQGHLTRKSAAEFRIRHGRTTTCAVHVNANFAEQDEAVVVLAAARG